MIRRSALIAGMIAATCGLFTESAGAVTTLTVDLATPIGPTGHVANGSLYGVTEALPADITALIAPLHPNVFVNPAADQQQPVGDAIVVAGRLAPVGGRVTIRLADWLKGFYTFTTMTDWLDKVGQTVSRKQASGLTNFYGYEIWNEPQGTWASSNPLSFNEFWMQTYAKLRELDPNTKIIGPSLSYYESGFMNGFLSFCKTNGCLPDIVSWHQLGNQNFTADVQNYRALEVQLGVGPLPISINEYSGPADIGVEGQPGASAALIAKFERLRIDSACISFWDVPHPGRLGSLLASNTAPNGGWWFYKWYGEMSGQMLSTTAPSPASPTALDGFANLDESSASASVLLGGTNDGMLQIIVKGFRAAPFLGSTVHALVEHVPFVDRTMAVAATDVLSTADVTVADDQITVTVSGANATDGYRLRLTPAAGGSGGADTGPGSVSGSGGLNGVGGDGLSASAGVGVSGSSSGGTGASSKGTCSCAVPGKRADFDTPWLPIALAFASMRRRRRSRPVLRC